MILAAAYYLAVSITNPLDAIVWFFVAVILVIIGTYLLLVAGSVLLCRVLQKNKKYYYRPEHFVSVSSMAYRMKRNGAGLASVCIIATMILVMISSSSCLYFGAEDAANMRYPRDINITLAGETPEQITDGNIERYRRAIADYTSERGVPPKDVQNYRYINTSGLFSGDTVQCWYSREGVSASYSELRDIYIVSTADYAARTGENVSLAPDEVLLLTYKCSYERPTLTLAMDDVSHTWRVADVRNGYFLPPTVGGFIAQMTLIVNDTASAVQDFRTYNGHVVTMQYKWVYNFNTDLDVKFSTYAVPMIIGEVRRFLRDNNSIRVSRSVRDTAYRAMQSRETLEKQLGREPTMDEIAQSAGLTRREVTAALESVVEPISLDEPVYTDGGDAMYVIDQVRDPDSEESWISGLQFRDTVAALTPREKRIMELRYLRGKTQMEVAQEIGISQAQVSRLEKGALQQFHTGG